MMETISENMQISFWKDFARWARERKGFPPQLLLCFQSCFRRVHYEMISDACPVRITAIFGVILKTFQKRVNESLASELVMSFDRSRSAATSSV